MNILLNAFFFLDILVNLLYKGSVTERYIISEKDSNRSLLTCKSKQCIRTVFSIHTVSFYCCLLAMNILLLLLFKVVYFVFCINIDHLYS